MKRRLLTNGNKVDFIFALMAGMKSNKALFKGYELEQDAENGDLFIRESFINALIDTNFSIDEFEKSLMITSIDSRKIFLNADVILEDICRIPSSMIPEDLKLVENLIYSEEIGDVFKILHYPSYVKIQYL